MTAKKSTREGDGHLDLSAGVQELCRNLIAVPAHHHVDARLAEPQIAQDKLAEEGRQARIAQADLAGVPIELEAERRLDERERRRGGPGLRRASNRIERGPAAAPPLEAAKKLG